MTGSSSNYPAGHASKGRIEVGRFLICYVTDRRGIGPESVEKRIFSAVEAGVDWVQIREKDLPTRTLLELTVSAASRARNTNTRIFVNDRLDVALAAGAHGVHLGGSSIPAKAVCSSVPPGMPVGVSCHSREEAVRAESEGARYVFFGPAFETPSKLSYGPPLGLERLAEVAASVKIPVLAIGGITPRRVADCLAHGAAGVAAIRMFQEDVSLEERIRELREILPYGDVR